MKIFLSECEVAYDTYTFPYAIYCKRENPAETPEIYQKGFLPFSGDSGLDGDYFYLARSLRVNLSKFSDSSENRRIHRKAGLLFYAISLESIDKSNFDTEDPSFRNLCLDYATRRYKAGSMDGTRLSYVTSRKLLNHYFVLKDGHKILGYVFAPMYGDIIHYWFSFFDYEYMESGFPLGKYLMWRTIKWAKQQGEYKYFYLGTCYKTSSLYKVRDHSGIEFFDGNSWNNDVKILKTLCINDDAREQKSDLFKSDLDIVDSLYRNILHQK